MTKDRLRQEQRAADQLEIMLNNGDFMDVVHSMSSTHLRMMKQIINATLDTRLEIANQLGHRTIESFEIVERS